MRAGATAVGAQVEITTIPGYLPMMNDPTLNALFAENVLRHFGPEDLAQESHMAGSTDLGDLAHLMPVIQPSMNGSTRHFSR